MPKMITIPGTEITIFPFGLGTVNGGLQNQLEVVTSG